MAEIINLRQLRKAKSRQQAEAAASHNRAIFGRTKAEKSLSALTKALEQTRHEGHRLRQDAQAPMPEQPSPGKRDDNR